ncbi:MAG TPA: hypothetical protein VE028_06530 [Nitratidesulfovibrio sp.]|nr:hypothetical protein [Nitratidesulfovibrio sp.]
MNTKFAESSHGGSPVLSTKGRQNCLSPRHEKFVPFVGYLLRCFVDLCLKIACCEFLMGWHSGCGGLLSGLTGRVASGEGGHHTQEKAEKGWKEPRNVVRHKSTPLSEKIMLWHSM